MSNSPWVRVAVAVVAAVLVAACSTTDPGGTGAAAVATGAPGKPLPTGVFVATVGNGYSSDPAGGRVAAFDETTGAFVRDLLVAPVTDSATQLSGYSLDSHRDLVYLIAGRPRSLETRTGSFSGLVPSIDPASCGGEVWALAAEDGTPHKLFDVVATVAASSPVTSPDGTRVAFLAGDCGTYQGSTTIVVHTLAGGAETRLGLTRAAAIGTLSWSRDGSRIAVAAEGLAEPPSTPVFNGVETTGRGFVVVPVQVGSQSATAMPKAPDAGCEVQAVAFDRAGLAVLEGCPSTTDAPARLVQLDPTATRVLWRADTGACPNGATIAADPTGERLLVNANPACGENHDDLQIWTGPQVRQVIEHTATAELVNDATW